MSVARYVLHFLAFACLAALAAAGCGGEGEGPAATTAPAGLPTRAPAKVSIEIGDAFFEPAEIPGEVGVPVEVTLENGGDAPHTFTIGELFVDEEVAPGKKATVTFTPTSPGELTFYCRYHVESGMRGSLRVRMATVTPPGAMPSGP